MEPYKTIRRFTVHTLMSGSYDPEKSRLLRRLFNTLSKSDLRTISKMYIDIWEITTSFRGEYKYSKNHRAIEDKIDSLKGNFIYYISSNHPFLIR